MATHKTDKDLMARVKSAGKRLTNAALWSTRQPFRFQNSFLLELYLLFRIVRDLKAHYLVSYDRGTGVNQDKFPQSGAPKAGRPRFLVKDRQTGDTVFQVCAGTEVPDINGHSRALDISIQKGDATDTPSASDVLQIFDAKYRSKFSSRISHHEFSEFARWIELFGLRGSSTASLNFDSLTDMDGNCLVTNGKHSTELDDECDRTCIREIARFHPNHRRKARP